MSAPAKPPDSALVPWSQVAVEGDPIFDAEWYIPIIRALNRRLKAINAMPIAEDSLNYTLGGSYYMGTSGPIELPLATGEDHGPQPPYGEANPTLWGFNAANGAGFLGGVGGSISGNPLEPIPGYAHYPQGNIETFFMVAPLIGTDGASGIGGAQQPYGGLLGAGFGFSSWRPLTQWAIHTVDFSIFPFALFTSLPISGQTEDPLDPIQFPVATPVQGRLSLATPTLGLPTDPPSPWNPAPGTPIYVLDRWPTPRETIVNGGSAFPTDFAAFPYSFPALFAIVQNLLCYFVDNSIDWSGKTKADIQGLCQNHQEWVQNSPIGFLGFPIPGLLPGNQCFFNFDNIPPLFQTAWPCWPPKTPPAGYPAGRPFGGFTRLRERQISRLSDPGEEGWIARFVWSRTPYYEDGQTIFSYDDPSQFHGPDWAVPADYPHLKSLQEEADYATKMMLFTGGKWTLHPEPPIIGDILTFYGPPKPGDIVGVHNVNELRAAISLLTDSISDEFVRWGYAQDSSGTQSGDKSAASGSDASGYSHTATAATTTAIYNAPPNPFYGSGREIFSWTMAGNDLSGPYFACASQAGKLFIYSLAHGMTRDVRFWMFTSPIPGVPIADYTFDNSGLTFATYSTYPDAAGTGTDAGQIVLAGTATGATADHVDLAGYVGSLPQWLPAFPATPSIGSPDQYRGIYLQPLVATCHWTFND